MFQSGSASGNCSLGGCVCLVPSQNLNRGSHHQHHRSRDGEECGALIEMIQQSLRRKKDKDEG